MPPKIKVTEEEIVGAALRIVREKGFENLNARDLAKELGCSVHPIFRVFNSMEGLKSEVYKIVEQIYNKQMQSALESGKEGFLSVGLTYINFARNEKNLFKLLFMSDAFREQSIMDIVGATEGDDEVIAMLSQMTGLSTLGARELYAGNWLTTHGIASMFATNSCKLNDEEIRRFLGNCFNGILMKLKMEEETK
ncbi:TetR/AcrR family transcriptional regulator [Anaerocolumna sp. AGMB13025]|uniref:TetR/AcrR family transcriptional regulator n=1 Tax=Anaerocolumna sp. AGMB13025 TaxID=3039116 RepID=UPI00241DE844|nr:TetR/AcrR family transcriptional regulator [Anaerocolumna sp. AGMB13025]WFR56562.1 TetR/AcrR family transcriptional regulator [Anaerocolumna sp. AGMB13025]